MMGIVRFALRFPHTFYVVAALILFLGVAAIRSMPTDIFPEIRIPVVTVIWSYTGLTTPEMEQRVSTYSQYSISANVNGIKNMEAQTLNGLSIQKIYFQPDVNLDLAIAQIVSATNSIRALMPPGIQPPIVVQFSASSVPVLQMSLTSDNLNEQQLYDYGIYRLRQQLAPVQGGTLQTARAAAPAGLKITEQFDQSVFVTSVVTGVLREGAIAAALTALMILLFLGSWRSTVVDMISIPLAILSSLVVLYFLGETLNTMTLGGLALAVGILVDDSTVTIENTHRLWTEEHMPLSEATLHGAAEIAVPTLVSTLAISCVFTSVVFLDGPAKYLFTPLGLAVVFAMLASYLLSRTLTPITIGLLLKNERHGTDYGTPPSVFSRLTAAFNRGFERLRGGYLKLLTLLLRRRTIVPVAAVLILGLGATMLMFVGRDFFPLIDGGQIQLHVRAPAGTRIESTEAIFQKVEDKIREVIPEKDRGLIIDNIGLPARAYNLAFADGSTIGINDGVIQVQLKEGHRPTAEYVKKLRQVLPAAFPESTFYFQAADIVTQILNFGLPAQIDVRTVGTDHNNLSIAKELQQRLAAIPGIVDAHLQQEVDGPAFYAEIDRTRAAQLGLNASTIATNINVSLSSSVQVSPNFWTDLSSGIPYYLAVQTPERLVNSLNALGNTPVSTSLAVSGQTVPGMLSNVATFKRDKVATNSNQTNIQPVFDVYASVQGRDLGSVAADIDKVTTELQKQMKPGNSIQVIGQIQSMNSSFRNLGIGLLFAAVFVYLLMVVNYQTFGDPFVVIMALPATLCGIVTMLFITGTTLNVPSLMGAIMAVAVASANSILLVTFPREQQLKGHSAFEAALSAGHTRIRPVLMTAAAMIVGMIPMAIGGAGEEQNAALARAVIGGLLFATPTTLLIVPYLFAMLRKGNDGRPAHGVFEELTE